MLMLWCLWPLHYIAVGHITSKVWATLQNKGSLWHRAERVCSYDQLWVWKPSALADFQQIQTLPIYKSVKSESLDLAILIWMVSLFMLCNLKLRNKEDITSEQMHKKKSNFLILDKITWVNTKMCFSNDDFIYWQTKGYRTLISPTRVTTPFLGPQWTTARAII